MTGHSAGERPEEISGSAWYAQPTVAGVELPERPRLASWERADHPSQVRLRRSLDATEKLVERPVGVDWTLRIDVGLDTAVDPVAAGDLDNYALPLASRLRDEHLVSVWCTKAHQPSSTVTVAPAVVVGAPGTAYRARIEAPGESIAYKEAVRDAVSGAAELADGPVRLEIAFGVGRTRNWLNLWKPTIDALDPILGRTTPGRDWHPRDGRITVLGLHVRARRDAGRAVDLAIVAQHAGEPS